MSATTRAADAGIAPARVEQLSRPALLALHLIPGALVTLAYVALAPAVESGGFPLVAALLAAIALVMVPLELGIVRFLARRHSHGFAEAIPFREPMVFSRP